MRVICRACGEPGTLYIKKVGERKYKYVKHYKKKSCYLGPVEGYEYVNGNYEKIGLNLDLRGVDEFDPISSMLRLLDSLEEKYKTTKDLKLKADLRMIRDRIDKILEESDTQDGQDGKQ
ncbi:hypothetical protein STSV1pORF57 [Sulfolobus virus STSV1]|uniref:hypothetical protein n=1 Tax=Sulfolobus virus STSV1 TaxID=285013 RepID=UPI000042B127|nr:hypothetical protein STSV1pORF57 [Sulfolobus virus STSV1]CAH04240.1 hypothetical protein [Sulfolobus virus STSV1]